jgi:glutamyl-tRNA synthetase/nondiscriminating glutamyl-tRNA synthetase
MQITHVTRGDDHLSNTPKQVVHYEAFGWKVPEFAHLSTILGADRQRLSKRHGAVSIANFRDSGVLPEALFNYLALLGWAPTGGDREIFSKEELVKEFDLGRVTPSAAVFDIDKLNWLNRLYIKEAAPERIAKLAQAYWDRMFRDSIVAQTGLTPAAEVSAPGYGLSDEAIDWLKKITALLVPSVDRLEQLPERASLIFDYDPVAAAIAPDNAEVLNAPNTPKVLDAFSARIVADPDAQAHKLSPERFKALVNEVKTETGVKGKDLFHPIRVALTGSHSGPEFDKLVPILEEGSRLKLPKRVMSVRERIEAFQAARKA